MEKMLSVTEYAELTGKDPGNIRRMLAAGRLEGSRIGGRWVIPFGAVYPADKREKTGKYRNWRKRIKLNSDRELMKVIKKMMKELAEIYGDLLREAILYGSYARGEQTGESDIDIAVILKSVPSRELTDRMIDCVAAYELEASKVFSIIDIQGDQYERWKDAMPFYRNIEKEGIALWKEA